MQDLEILSLVSHYNTTRDLKTCMSQYYNYQDKTNLYPSYYISLQNSTVVFTVCMMTINNELLQLDT
jgi:hypothetical protein